MLSVRSSGTVHQTVLQIRQIQTSVPALKNAPASIRGYWYNGKNKKGGVNKPQRDVINGVQLLSNHEKLRFSYQGKHKYEWDRTEPLRMWDRPELPKPHYGQYERKAGAQIPYSENCGYRLTVKKSDSVVKRDQKRQQQHEKQFGENLETRIARKLHPLPCSFVDPLVWRFVEKIKMCRYTGLDRGFDIMVETLKLIKVHQMHLQKANPKQKYELDANKILRQAVLNVAPPLRIDFVQVSKTRDGYKPCPVPLTEQESIVLAIKRFKIRAKRRKTKTPVEPNLLANLVLDAYNKRGELWETLLEDAMIGEKYQDMYQRFGRVTYSSTQKQRLAYREQTHLSRMMHVTLPLENKEYGRTPGQPQWNEDEKLDEEDKRDKPLRRGVGDFVTN